MTATHLADTCSPEWQLACLARHICRMPGKADRHRFLDLMRKHHRPEFIATVEQKVRDEWVLTHPPANAPREAHGNP